MKKFLYYAFFRPLMWIFYVVCYGRVKIIHKERIKQDGRQVIVCNHLSKIDPFIVGKQFHKLIYILAKEEWFKNKLFAAIISCMGAIPINRENPSLSTFKRCMDVLNKENRLLIFPEGTRNKQNEDIQQVKQGAAFFALKSKSPILPFVIHNKPKMFRRTYVIVGEYIDFSEFYNKPIKREQLEKCDRIIQDRLKVLKGELDEFVAEKESKKRK